jgi:hypothetical protein
MACVYSIAVKYRGGKLMDTKVKIVESRGMANDSQSVFKGNSFKPSAPQNVAPPKPVIVPWQKKK